MAQMTMATERSSNCSGSARLGQRHLLTRLVHERTKTWEEECEEERQEERQEECEAEECEEEAFEEDEKECGERHEGRRAGRAW